MFGRIVPSACQLMANFIGRHVRKRNRLVIIHLTKPYNLSINNKKMKQIQEKQTNKKQKLIIYLITVQLATRQPIICQPRHLMWNEHYNNGSNLWRETETWKPTKVLLVVIWRPNNCPTDNIATPAPVLLLLLLHYKSCRRRGATPSATRFPVQLIFLSAKYNIVLAIW